MVSDAWKIFAPSNWGRWIQFFPIIFFRWVETQPPTSQTEVRVLILMNSWPLTALTIPLLLPEVAREDWNCPSCLGTEPWCNPTCDAQCEADTVGWMSVEFRKWLHHINGIKSYSVYSYMHVIKTYTDNLIVIIYIYIYIYISIDRFYYIIFACVDLLAFVITTTIWLIYDPFILRQGRPPDDGFRPGAQAMFGRDALRTAETHGIPVKELFVSRSGPWFEIWPWIIASPVHGLLMEFVSVWIPGLLKKIEAVENMPKTLLCDFSFTVLFLLSKTWLVKGLSCQSMMVWNDFTGFVAKTCANLRRWRWHWLESEYLWSRSSKRSRLGTLEFL